MRSSLWRWCSKVDLDGRPSAYSPRFRPRRLVMPVDPNKVHSEDRGRNRLLLRHKQQQRIQKATERRGVVHLATVPEERTVGDMFRYMLEVCDERKLFDRRARFSSAPWAPLEKLVEEARQMEGALTAARAKKAAERRTCSEHGLPTTRASAESEGSGQTAALRVRTVDSMWSLLDRTPLSSPVHGALAQRGKALVEHTIATTAYDAFPRLRSKHLQALLHESCGLLPSSRVAVQMGFAEHALVEGDIGMWRELNVLTQRVRTARAKAAAHLERMEKGVAQQRRWYWRGVLKAALGRLTLFPVHMEDLQPRLEWVRSSLFAFVGFLEMAQRSGETGISADTFVLGMYCGQLGRFAYQRGLLREAEALLRRSDGESEEDLSGDARRAWEALRRDMEGQLRLVRGRTPDEMEVLEGRVHPLNERADLRREQFASSGGTHAIQSLKDDLFDDYRAERHADAAPPIVIHSLEMQNALKEAQLILRYAPDVVPALRDGAIDVDQVIRKTVEVHETNSYASLRYEQQYRQVEYTVCRLFCANRCIGEGKGESLMEAIQEAALQMTTNYYLRGGEALRLSTQQEPSHEDGKAAEQQELAEVVRIRNTRTEEELAF